MIDFPNHSRSYDATRRAVRFWGHDSAIEAALVLQVRRLAPQVCRLEDAPAEIAALLETLVDLTLTHSRRSEEQVALDQFSTPLHLGALAVLASLLSLMLFAGTRLKPIAPGIGLVTDPVEAATA